MTPQEQERLAACSAEIAEILYRNSDPEGLESLDGIEQTVRQQMLAEVSPRIALFFINQQTSPAQRRRRRLKSLVGSLEIRQSQAEQLGVKAYSRLSSGLEKASLQRIVSGCRGGYRGPHRHERGAFEPTTLGGASVI